MLEWTTTSPILDETERSESVIQYGLFRAAERQFDRSIVEAQTKSPPALVTSP